MDKRSVTEFFDKLAPTWDDSLIHDDDRIGRILDIAGVTEGSRVLDVACGTGVLIGDYLARGVSGITGVDISPGMIRAAMTKFDDPRIELICGDIERMSFASCFDCCVVYNALPHFTDPALLIQRLAPMLCTGGRLTIAHSMSRDDINAHHARITEVSRKLPPALELADAMRRFLAADTVISDSEMYVVSGILITD